MTGTTTAARRSSLPDAAGPAPVAGGEPTDFALILTVARTGRAPLSAAAVAACWVPERGHGA